MAGSHDEILWGSIVSSGNNQFRIGISRTWEDKGTYEYAHIKVWFWSKLSFYDSNNHLDLALAGVYNEHTTHGNYILVNAKSTNINVGSGGTQCICEYEINLYKKQTANNVNWNAALSGLEAVGTGTGIYATRNYEIEALASHTVKYNANGGTNAPSNQTKWYGTVLTLTSEQPTRTGYTFWGWGTSANATVATYPAGGSYGADADITLYAVWKPNQYTIAFDSNGGNVNENSKTVTYDSAYGELPIPTKTGYTFINWYTEEGTIVTEDTIVNISSDHTLFASWEANTYVITLNPNGGEVVVDSLEVVYETIQNNNISQYVPVRQAYEFLGWYDANGIQVYDANGLCTNDGIYWLDDVCVYTDDYELYAQWKALNIAYYKHEGEWKLCRTYIKVDNTWKPAIMYIKLNNKYIR